ncbi:MAG TPA: RsmE family RNA methyltransferase [Chitinophagales bacterium]|nr:RsmE family RNA methyltransferase [Chitinophagales bacterium]
MNIFYCPGAELNAYCELDETESRHVATVLRKREGEELYVFDGAGNLYNSLIQNIDKHSVTVNIVRLIETQGESTYPLHIAIAPPKNIERLEWFAEKVTEIGIDEITPLLCKHSERKDLRADRIEKILLGACKQSLKYRMPKLNPVIKFADFVNARPGSEQRFIAYCDEKAQHLKDVYTAGKPAVILIGPEGDFTNEEVLVAEKNGFEAVSLGKSRLRLETAGIYAATVFNLANEQVGQ